IQTVIILTTGTLLLMWLGEQITERGIGNGISLVISIGILARMPQALVAFADMFNTTDGTGVQIVVFKVISMIFLLFGVIAGVIAVTQAQRKVAVQYAQRAVGRKVVGGQTSFLPLRLNFTGVMPIIFAQSILMFPQKVLKFLGDNYSLPVLAKISNMLLEGKTLYMIIYGAMILFFSY